MHSNSEACYAPSGTTGGGNVFVVDGVVEVNFSAFQLALNPIFVVEESDRKPIHK